jgi:hypothetical protein
LKGSSFSMITLSLWYLPVELTILKWHEVSWIYEQNTYFRVFESDLEVDRPILLQDCNPISVSLLNAQLIIRCGEVIILKNLLLFYFYVFEITFHFLGHEFLEVRIKSIEVYYLVTWSYNMRYN